MRRISAILRYLIATYPYAEDLFPSTVIRLVYWADWTAACRLGTTLTRSPWILEGYGPQNAAVWTAMHHDRRIQVTPRPGRETRIVQWRGPAPVRPRLPRETRQILDAVIQETQDLSFIGLVALVAQTAPVATQVQGAILDLAAIAARATS